MLTAEGLSCWLLGAQGELLDQIIFTKGAKTTFKGDTLCIQADAFIASKTMCYHVCWQKKPEYSGFAATCSISTLAPQTHKPYTRGSLHLPSGPYEKGGSLYSSESILGKGIYSGSRLVDGEISGVQLHVLFFGKGIVSAKNGPVKKIVFQFLIKKSENEFRLGQRLSSQSTQSKHITRLMPYSRIVKPKHKNESPEPRSPGSSSRSSRTTNKASDAIDISDSEEDINLRANQSRTPPLKHNSSGIKKGKFDLATAERALQEAAENLRKAQAKKYNALIKQRKRLEEETNRLNKDTEKIIESFRN